MLGQILKHINNWFVVPDGIHTGNYTVQDGSITLPFLADGQYYRILGSVFNDGLHKYGDSADVLQDEDWDGAIWALAIPADVIDLAAEIQEWQTKTDEASPYTSESFGGYSYSRATSSTTGAAVTWQDVFRGRLNDWRRIGGI